MHPLTLIESCRISWRPKRGCKHSWQQVVHFRSGSNVRESPLLVQIFVSMLTHIVTRIYLRKKAGFPGSIGTHSWGCVSTYWEGQNTGKQSRIPAQRSGYRKQLSREIVIPSFPVTKDKDRSLFLCCVNSDLWDDSMFWAHRDTSMTSAALHCFTGGSSKQQSMSKEHQAGRRPRTETEVEVGRKRLGHGRKFFWVPRFNCLCTYLKA